MWSEVLITASTMVCPCVCARGFWALFTLTSDLAFSLYNHFKVDIAAQFLSNRASMIINPIHVTNLHIFLALIREMKRKLELLVYAFMFITIKMPRFLVCHDLKWRRDCPSLMVSAIIYYIEKFSALNITW